MWRTFLKFAVLVLSLTHQAPTTEGANILALFPTVSPSHLIIEMAVVRALAERKHNITVVTILPIMDNFIDSNITYIQVQPNKEKITAIMQHVTQAKGLQLLTLMPKVVGSLSDIVAVILEDEVFLNFMHNEDNNFDLMIYGYLFADFVYGVGAHFNCPIAIIWPNQLRPHLLSLIGSPHQTSYVPLPMSSGSPSDDGITFKFRLRNVFGTAFEMVMMSALEQRMRSVYDKHFPADRYPDYETAKESVSLILYSHHFSEKPVRALVPGLIEIGGIQLNEQPNELPQDIAEFLDDAHEHGAILFSLGTNVQEKHLESNTLKIIFNVFSKLPQKVIWKCDNISEVPGNSSNILYKTWLPQADILAHRNIRLFFNHGGKGGITEAQFYGVPMLMLPIFGDQPMNSEEIVHKGYGVEIKNQHNLTEVDVQKALMEVLGNSKYRLAVQQFSKIYRDRPMSAKESAVYWLEYVIRYRGAPHMQSPLRSLNFVQKHNLDVLLFLFVSVYIAMLCVKFSFKTIGKIIGKARGKKLKTN